jgi:hypothetical protein
MAVSARLPEEKGSRGLPSAEDCDLGHVVATMAIPVLYDNLTWMLVS